MIRTQISLEEQDYETVRREAAARGISIAEFVRRALRNALPETPESLQRAPWMRYAGFVASGDTRSSRKVDEVVYGPE